MADKDTREDDPTRGEVLPLPDGPRSEGRQPAHEPEPAPEPDADPPVISDTPDLEPADLGSPDFEPIAGGIETTVERTPPEGVTEAPPSDVTPDAADDSAAAESAGAETIVRQSDEDTWHSAIADALAERELTPDEPREQPEPEPQQSDVPAAEPPFMTWIEPVPASAPRPDETPDVGHDAEPRDEPTATSPEPEPKPEPNLEPEPPAVVTDETPAPAAQEPPSAPDAPPTREIDDPSFTAAAQDLFRPSESETAQEPHLITLGRRLDPSLRIPRPVPPLIAPRESTTVDVPRWRDLPWKDRLRIAARYALYAVGGYLALVLVLILLFRFVNPPGSMLMLTQFLTGTSIDRTWVPLSSISPHLVRAVIVSEDGRFCEHSGIDTAAIREAIERANRGTPRGASTISMQVTKNMFLWNAKSYIRKVIEIPLTLIMELVWPKQRILEVYLNIAEWGPGVFGAEAAARHHFNKSAARLNEREAALLASVLPNPVVRNAGSPGRQTSAKARVVQSRVRAYGAVASCVTAHAGKTPAATPAATRPRTIRKTPTAPANRTPPPRKKQQQPADGWAPTLNFGQP